VGACLQANGQPKPEFAGKADQVQEQGLADALAAHRLAHEQVLEVEPRLAGPGRIVVEEQRESGRFAAVLGAVFGNHRLGPGVGSEQAVVQQVGRGLRRVRLLFVDGQLADQFQQQPDVGRGRGSQGGRFGRGHGRGARRV